MRPNSLASGRFCHFSLTICFLGVLVSAMGLNHDLCKSFPMWGDLKLCFSPRQVHWHGRARCAAGHRAVGEPTRARVENLLADIEHRQQGRGDLRRSRQR